VCGGLSELSDPEVDRLAEFLESEITGDPERPGATNLTEHRIDVGGHAPIKQRYYPVSPKIQRAIYAEVDKMLEAGIIEPSRVVHAHRDDLQTERGVSLLSRFSKIK